MEIDLYLMELEEKAKKVIDNFDNQMQKIAVGRANPNLINKIKVDYYGSEMTLDELASIAIATPLQLLVKPYDVGSTKEIEKAIKDYNLPIQIANEGNQIRLTYPSMTTEKRKEMVKELNHLTEHARIGIRQIRQDINKSIKNDKELSEDLQKNYLDVIQKNIDSNIDKINNLSSLKEKDLLTI
ncbi:ribosome recycling factor [Mycoplasma miroungirhinis]|uniref:Ribosome-recycling factor n=1 Tax=Mycoplasma miroungirhinis TaxID=754516 RepID=A0A6M4JDY3_9MOLU|nr:ribosome recycling factor [Mycoplasma miroungirhinis]QJR44297.1 ribosome recycling factor [Mycoplasma miroungirhinis]